MSSYNFSNLSVLLVDDYRPMRQILRSVLRELGIKDIAEASNGREAIKKLKDFKADVIITDNKMAPVSGTELIKKIRFGEGDIDPFIPIIMVSAYTETKNIRKARDAGTTEFLAKPISAKQVYLRLCTVIEKPRRFIRSKKFFGPDRRRRIAKVEGGDRRHSKGQPPSNATEDQRHSERD